MYQCSALVLVGVPYPLVLQLVFLVRGCNLRDMVIKGLQRELDDKEILIARTSAIAEDSGKSAADAREKSGEAERLARHLQGTIDELKTEVQKKGCGDRGASRGTQRSRSRCRISDQHCTREQITARARFGTHAG